MFRQPTAELADSTWSTRIGFDPIVMRFGSGKSGLMNASAKRKLSRPGASQVRPCLITWQVWLPHQDGSPSVTWFDPTLRDMIGGFTNHHADCWSWTLIIDCSLANLTYGYWKWPFIVSFPIKEMWFSIVMLVYQRVVISEKNTDSWTWIMPIWRQDPEKINQAALYKDPLSMQWWWMGL